MITQEQHRRPITMPALSYPCPQCGTDCTDYGTWHIECRCKKVRYCSRKCQQRNWNEHRANCVPATTVLSDAKRRRYAKRKNVAVDDDKTKKRKAVNRLRMRIARRSSTKEDEEEYYYLTGHPPERIKKETPQQKSERLRKDRLRHCLGRPPDPEKEFSYAWLAKANAWYSWSPGSGIWKQEMKRTGLAKKQLFPTEPKERKKTLDMLRKKIIRETATPPDRHRYTLLTGRVLTPGRLRQLNNNKNNKQRTRKGKKLNNTACDHDR